MTKHEVCKNEVKYPEIEVQLTGEDGNAFAIIGRVTKALKENGSDTSEIAIFQDEAMGGDYNDLLQTCLKWVTVL